MDEMATVIGSSRGFEERFATLDERVNNLRSSFNNLEASTRQGFSQSEATLSAFSARTEASIQSLSNQIGSAQKPQWTVIAMFATLFVTIMGVLFGMVSNPLTNSVNELKANDKEQASLIAAGAHSITDLIGVLPKEFIGRADFDQRVARAADDRKALGDVLEGLRADKLSRAEWSLRNEAVNSLVGDLNRRVDEIRQELVSIAGPRDALEELGRRIDRLETGKAGG
jgi:hypothetical protein